MECEFCDKKATVEWEVRGYTPTKTSIIVEKDRHWPVWRIYVCDEHDEKAERCFPMQSLPSVRKSRKLPITGYENK